MRVDPVSIHLGLRCMTPALLRTVVDPECMQGESPRMLRVVGHRRRGLR